MSLQTTMPKKQVRSSALPIAVILLSSYVVGTSQFALLHEFIHSHNHFVSHTETDEADLCHRAVYHNDGQKNCGHHSHIVVADKCELCDSISHSDQVFVSSVESNYQRLFPVDFSLHSQEEPVRIGPSGLPSRAPPAM